jgi:uncharacterized protein (UPF0332 family)
MNYINNNIFNGTIDMSKFCPEWVFSLCCAQTAKDFLSTNNTINVISKKFSTELSTLYNEVKFEEISDASEKILQFLSEINAQEEAVNFLNDYIFNRVSFNANGSERKIKSMFSSAFDPEKVKEYNSEKTLKNFRANIYSIRNNVMGKATPGWVIDEVEDIDWLGELFNQDVNIKDL